MSKEVELVPLSGGLAATWVMTGSPHQCPSDEVLPRWQLCCGFPWCQQDTIKGVMLAQTPQSYRWPWDGSCGERREDVRLPGRSLWGWQSNPTGYCHVLPSPLTPPRSYYCFSLYLIPGQSCLTEHHVESLADFSHTNNRLFLTLYLSKTGEEVFPSSFLQPSIKYVFPLLLSS